MAAPRPRHGWIVASFVGVVLIPLAAIVFYLYEIAADQYISKVGFSVRSEQISSAAELLGGLSSLSGSSSRDTDILYKFIEGQDLVERVLVHLNLPEIYSRPEFDPVYAFWPTGKIEDLVKYWKRMVRINYDPSTSLIELDVHAFRPDEAQQIAQQVVAESSLMINRLSAIARDDATRYAREDLNLALERLKSAREAVTQFRSANRIIDPSAGLQGQLGLLNSLLAQLAEAQIDVDLLRQTTRANDPRIEQTERRVAVIKDLIEKERAQFGSGDGDNPGDQDYAKLVGDYERLAVDLEYAEKAYLTAQAGLDAAVAEAARQSRYLATYNQPTLPQSARYPARFRTSVLAAVFLILTWCIGVLVYYSVRDRR